MLLPLLMVFSKTVGTTFGQVGFAGVEAKMHLIDLAGGFDKLSGLVSDFLVILHRSRTKAVLSNVNQKLVSQLGITWLRCNSPRWQNGLSGRL